MALKQCVAYSTILPPRPPKVTLAAHDVWLHSANHNPPMRFLGVNTSLLWIRSAYSIA